MATYDELDLSTQLPKTHLGPSEANDILHEASNVRGPHASDRVLDKLPTATKLMRPVQWLQSGRVGTWLPFVGVHPIKRRVSSTQLVSLAANGGTATAQGNFQRRAVSFDVFNYDATNGITVTIKSSLGSDSFWLAAGQQFGEDVDMPGDTQIIITNNAGAAVNAQALIWGY